MQYIGSELQLACESSPADSREDQVNFLPNVTNQIAPRPQDEYFFSIIAYKRGTHDELNGESV